MKRREFIALLGGAALRPFAARAQQAKRLPRIGVLLFGERSGIRSLRAAFKVGMAERGYENGRNVRFEIRYSDLDREKLTRNARELAAAKVDLIWVPGSTTAQAAREATAAIPIVFAIVSDPVLRVSSAASRRPARI